MLDLNAILTGRVQIKSNETEPLPLIKSHMHQEAERINSQQHEGKFVYGNSGGHSLFDMMGQMKSQLDKLQTDVPGLSIVVGQLQAEVDRIPGL